MANHLKMAEVQVIQTLRQRGWSFRRIARELGIHRDTAKRYASLAEAGATNLPTGPEGQNRPNPPAGSDVPNRLEQSTGIYDQNGPNPPTGSDGLRSVALGLHSARPTLVGAPNGQAGCGPPSRCEPFQAFIKEALDRGLSGQRIWQDLCVEHGFTGGYDSVKRYVRRLGAAIPLPFRRMECEPGAEAQIDFGVGAPVITPEDQPLPVGVKTRRRKTHAFRIVLSHSRKAYSEAVYHQSTEDFIRCIENAFWHFGGVPKTLVIDNLKAAVTKADWYDPELNPKIVEFCRHYGTVVLPCKPYMPRHKGKAEREIDYVQENGLKGRQFTSLAEQNRHLLEWETQTADTRIHGTTRQQVKKAFEESERPALLPLPAMRFPSFHEGQRKVNRDGHVEVDKAYYSVPPEYLTRSVWVRWDARLVRIFNQRFEPIAVHTKHEPGRFSTDSAHIVPQKRGGIERGKDWMLNRAGVIGDHAGRWAEQMIQQRGIEGIRVLQGLLNLANRHPADAIERACEIAATHGAYRLRIIRELIKRDGGRQEQFEFVQEHSIIRSMAEYGQLVPQAFGGHEHE